MGKLWSFTDNLASFRSLFAHRINSLYFPLCNDTLMSSITPDLHGDIKSGQDAFLLSPVSRIDLAASRASRNFWIYIDKDKIWSATGVSKDILRLKKDEVLLEAGILWQKVTRLNKEIGMAAEILSFVPYSSEPAEIMFVTLTNISSRKISFIPTAAIPMYCRGAGSIRDHRHVTSLLQRIDLHEFGVISKPTLSFDEAGHRPNDLEYFVLGWDEQFNSPQYLYPTQEMFCGDAGDLEAPESLLNDTLPTKCGFQGREPMGALRFRRMTLNAHESFSFVIAMGIAKNRRDIDVIVNRFSDTQKVAESFFLTKSYWKEKSEAISVKTKDFDFDNWLRWVSIQPVLRKIYGCSFLPDFDYGKGGRGWRDLWQDCLGLILSGSKDVRRLLIANFGGVRPDGTNATIIGKNPGEFIADRNNLSRVWMDHAIWPLITLNLYIHETGDYSILFEKAPYFCDRHPPKAKGTILEHLLLQHLAQFNNLGSHKFIRLQGADWNDGLDMAKEFGESVAFSCMYAHNLRLLAGLVARQKTKKNLRLAAGLEQKAVRMLERIRKREWLKEGFFNGYYDDLKQRVEGKKKGILRMMLASQVFAIMSGVANQAQCRRIIRSVDKYLYDKKLKGYHLNTDFKDQQHNLGRAFSFIYGDKENGAFFNHMVVMYAYALYLRGFVDEGWKALSSIYRMAMDLDKSKIYPCLPEYFDGEGKGMYSYLTGSASWYMLTLLTEVFGVKGKGGDLGIEPKLTAGQFKSSSTIAINRIFAGRKLHVVFTNSKKLDYPKYKIIGATLDSKQLIVRDPTRLTISRKTLLDLPPDKLITISVVLG